MKGSRSWRRFSLPPSLSVLKSYWRIWRGIERCSRGKTCSLLERGFDVAFLDCTIQEHPWRLLEEWVRYLRPEVVGISVTCTYFICDAMKAARLGTDVSPNSIISAGEAYPSLIAEETLRERRAIDLIREVFGSPVWLQETYRSFEDYLKGRGRPLESGL